MSRSVSCVKTPWLYCDVSRRGSIDGTASWRVDDHPFSAWLCPNGVRKFVLLPRGITQLRIHATKRPLSEESLRFQFRVLQGTWGPEVNAYFDGETPDHGITGPFDRWLQRALKLLNRKTIYLTVEVR